MKSTMLLSHFCFAISCLILNKNLVNCGIGFITESVSDSKFYCDTSKMRVLNKTSELQCIHKCARLENCQLLNYRLGDEEGKNCEVFTLPHKHKSCRMAKGEAKWKALVYQDRCSIRNYCYPCTCNGDCTPNMKTCQCRLGLQTPVVHISFEEVINDLETAYTRGSDKSLKASVSLVNGTKVGPTTGRIGNVLQLSGIDPGAIAGYYNAHFIKILSPQPTRQTIFGTGRADRDTGTLLQVAESAKKIDAWVITTSMYLSLTCDVGSETLTSWTYVALVSYADTTNPKLDLFVNGEFATCTMTAKYKIKASGRDFPFLVFGAFDALFPLNQQPFNIQIDDFAVWFSDMSDQISHIMYQSKKSKFKN